MQITINRGSMTVFLDEVGDNVPLIETSGDDNIDIFLSNKSEVRLVGRLDTSSSPVFEKYMCAVLEKDSENGNVIKELVLDFSELEYISSAGLRVLLIIHKSIDKRLGIMSIANVQASVLSVLEITGFSGIFNLL
ncbi:hypothetical protein FACS1894120_5500 [Clostridia bacterium]|nr:hypothetical protein FACS1894120_5500 [Clostridia bacterium]